MARASSLLLPISIFTIFCLSTSAHGGDTSFIEGSCNVTNYPDLCVQSLSVYADTIQKSPRQLALTALSVSLDKAQETKSFVSKIAEFKGLKDREYGALNDCVEEIGDTVSRVDKSMNELKNAGDEKSEEFSWHMSNVETWVSAALTDENTCTDGFAGTALNGRVKSSIKARIVNVEQFTSNALALINKFAAES